MCGITGIFDLNEHRSFDRNLVQAMSDALTHRGPDGQGIQVEPGFGFGHRRLSIIDLEGGQQPMISSDGDVVLTYNGEIYNYRQLRDELIAEGASFRTNSDTEVILHAWRVWGQDCVKRFNGMFAFALSERSTETLFLARDHIGIKPLYYAPLAAGQFVFGSELKSLLVHPDLKRRINPPAVEDYFTFGYVPDPKTILEGVYKLPPGHTLTLRRGEPVSAPQCYWDLPFSGDLRNVSEVGEELIARMRNSVKAQMVSDVPVGAFLSGGVDSSAVVAMMADGTSAPVTSCSIAFGDAKFDESSFAAMVARRYNTQHHVDKVDAEAFALLDKLSAAYDEPFADSSALPTYEVCRLARTHAKVILSGDGGDESFAGYRRHRWSAYQAQVRRWLPQSVRGPFFGLAGNMYPKLDWAPRMFRAKSTLQELSRDNIAGYRDSVAITTDRQRRTIFSSQFEQQLDGYRSIEVFREHARRAEVPDALSMVQYLDFKTYLPGDILTKVDRASMAHALEVRVPLLDHDFVAWAAQLNSGLKLKDGEGKYILKKALQPHIPHEVLYRPKMGFTAPLAKWLREPLYKPTRAALLESLPTTGLFDRKALENLLEQHRSGVSNHAALLWALLMFDGFQRRVLENTDRLRDVG